MNVGDNQYMHRTATKSTHRFGNPLISNEYHSYIDCVTFLIRLLLLFLFRLVNFD